MTRSARSGWTIIRTVLWWPLAAAISFCGGLLAFPLAPIAVWLARPTGEKIIVPWTGKPGVQWPGPDDATGRVALGLPRLENYRTAAPQGAE